MCRTRAHLSNDANATPIIRRGPFSRSYFSVDFSTASRGASGLSLDFSRSGLRGVFRRPALSSEFERRAIGAEQLARLVQDVLVPFGIDRRFVPLFEGALHQGHADLLLIATAIGQHLEDAEAHFVGAAVAEEHALGGLLGFNGLPLELS